MVSDLTSQRALAQHDTLESPAGKMRLLVDRLRPRKRHFLAPALSIHRPVCKPLEPSQSAEDRGSKN